MNTWEKTTKTSAKSYFEQVRTQLSHKRNLLRIPIEDGKLSQYARCRSISLRVANTSTVEIVRPLEEEDGIKTSRTSVSACLARHKLRYWRIDDVIEDGIEDVFFSEERPVEIQQFTRSVSGKMAVCKYVKAGTKGRRFSDDFTKSASGRRQFVV